MTASAFSGVVDAALSDSGCFGRLEYSRSTSRRFTVEFDQLTGRYIRLKQELAAAYSARPRRDDHIDRLADDLASIERQLSATSHRTKPLPEAARSASLVRESK